VAQTFADTVFFTNSGAEAVECAIKMARRYHYAAGAPDRYRLITFQGAFHGRTLATIAAGGRFLVIRAFVATVVATAMSVLERTLQNAVDIKSEHDLTV